MRGGGSAVELREDTVERGVERALSTKFASGPADFEAVELSLLISGSSELEILGDACDAGSAAFEGAATGGAFDGAAAASSLGGATDFFGLR